MARRRYSTDDYRRAGMGQKTDAEVASVLGVTQQAVHHQRKKHGIPALHPGHGPGPGLGAVPQTEPCRRAGCPNLAWWKYYGACCPEHEGPA